MGNAIESVTQSPWAFLVLSILTLVSAVPTIARALKFLFHFILQGWKERHASAKSRWKKAISESAKKLRDQPHFDLKVSESIARTLKDVLVILVLIALIALSTFVLNIMIYDIDIGNSSFSDFDIIWLFFIMFLNLVAILLRSSLAYLWLTFDIAVWREARSLGETNSTSQS